MKAHAILAAALLVTGVAGAKAEDAQKDIAVVIKATDSDFWQYLAVGANNYAKEHPNVKVTIFGAASESDVDKQVAILENLVAKKVAGILVAPSSSDAPAPVLKQAAAAGIAVVTVDNRVSGYDGPHLATDNLAAGAKAADTLLGVMKAHNLPLKGKIGVVSAVAGVEVLVKRDGGFAKRLAEIAPDLQSLPIRYVDNDIQKSMSVANDEMLANPDIVGFFADNNHTGDGVALAVRGAKKGGKIAVVAFDSDPEEVHSLADGLIDALLLQAPYEMGHEGVDYVVRSMGGEKLPAYTDTGVFVATKENMNDPKMRGLLDPFSLKK
jgi:ribose transport system substrate-binding protein